MELLLRWVTKQRIQTSRNIKILNPMTGEIMLTKKLSLLITLICFSTIAWGQTTNSVSVDSLQKLSFSGSIDTYYHKSFNTKQNAPRTSFSNLPGFSLGMINLVLDYSGSKTGFIADIVFGPRGTDAIFNAPRYKNATGGGSSQMINQMFAYYSVNERIRLNVGQFNTFVGYESISPTKNIHYSTSYLFSFGPFNHTGIWADFKFSDHCAAKVALMNPTDYTEYNPFNLYTVGGQLSISNKKSMLNFNITYGDPDGQLDARDSIGSISAGNALQLDFTALLNSGEKYTVGISTSARSIGSGQIQILGNDHTVIERCGYYGVAFYQTLLLSPSAKIAVRSEYFTEFNGGIGAIGRYNTSGRSSVAAFTLSGNLTQSNLRLVPEIRIDKTSTPSFTESATGKSTRQMISVNVAVIYQIPAISHRIKM
jgi:hypothetical protein